MTRQHAAWSFVFITFAVGAAQANAPLGRYTVSADTVVDNRTHLTWQRAASMVVAFATFDQVQARCTSAGSGWRLPTIAELHSIVDISQFNPSIDASVFLNTPTVNTWTSTPVPGSSGSYWAVDFHDGRTYRGIGDNPSAVRCVR